MRLRHLAVLIVLTHASATPADDSWRHYGGDLHGRRFSPHTQIDAGNVADLDVAWTYRTGDVPDGTEHPGTTSFKATPILLRDTLYFSTPFNRVIALAADSGAERWTFDPQVDFEDGYAEMYTSRGVSAWVSADPSEHCGARIFLGTLDARLIALDAGTGEPCKAFGRRGEIDLSQGIRNYRRGEYSVTSPPAVIGDVIVVGSSVGDNGAVALDRGNVRAYDVRSGELLWDWDPIPRTKGAPGYDTWSDEGARRTGAANVWSIISGDADRGLVFVPTTSPSPDFFGGVRKGDNLFANSVVALRATTGERVWHFQTVHHDVWDYDVASQPMLTRVRRDGDSLPVVVQATKMGHVFVLDRDSGQPVFPVEERRVPQTDVAEEQTAATQPFPLQPAPLHPVRLSADDIWSYTPEHEAACRRMFDGYRNDGMFTPPSLEGTIVYPGNPGGVNWGSMAIHEDRQIVLTIVRRWPTVVTLIPRADFARRAREANPLNAQFTAQRGTPYGMMRHDFVNPNNDVPCHRGPWGTLIAINLADGTIRWETPVGVFPEAREHPEASRWGTLPSGGPIVTAGDLVFAATNDDPALYVYDLETGRELQRLELPAGSQATPMTYVANDRQFVVVAAGGVDGATGQAADYLLGFALPEE